jgi:hypothetical protein
MEQADRLDPGWRLEELEAKRAGIPDAENSALVVLNAARLLPKSWRPWLGEGTPANDALEKSPLAPAEQLDAQQVRDLIAALAPAKAALTESRKLSDLSNGRYLNTSGPDILLLQPPHLDDVGKIAALLSFDVLLRAQDHDIDGALASCQGLLNVARSVGDEPAFFSQVVRMQIGPMATRSIERVLAQGQPSEAALSALQRLLEKEAVEPLFLIGSRGQRVAWERLFEDLRSGKVMTSRLQQTVVSVAAYSSRAALLSLNNAIVEIAKLPVEEQLERLKEEALFEVNSRNPKDPTFAGRLQAGQRPLFATKDFPPFAKLYLVPRADKITTDLAKGQARTQAELRCAIAALAAERYRQAHGNWPSSLESLVPDYLAKVQADPFGGKPLRLRRLEKGMVIYSVGPDGQANGDIIVPGKPDGPGFRLWDEQYRRQPPRH